MAGSHCKQCGLGSNQFRTANTADGTGQFVWGVGGVGYHSTEEGGWIGCRRPPGLGNPKVLCALKRMGTAWHCRQDRLACASRLHNETAKLELS